MYQHRKDRLIELIDHRYGGVRKRVCDASGWTEARISQLLSPTYREGRAFSEKAARKLEQDLQLDPLYFDRDGSADDHSTTTLRAVRAVQKHPMLALMAVTSGDPPIAGRVAIRRFKEVRLSAGMREGFDGELDQREGGKHYLPARFIEKNSLNPNMLFAVEVEGESMEDTLYAGNLVVVNRADKLPVSGEIYAVNVGDKATIKRLIKKGPMWHLSSDNQNKKAHPDISMAEAQGEVIGKVVWREGGL